MDTYQVATGTLRCLMMQCVANVTYHVPEKIEEH